MDDRAEIIFKVLIIGDSMVGKSCLLHRFAEDQFVEELEPTIGVDCRPTYLNLQGRWLKLKIWDTAGQEKYRSITKSFYHGAHGAIVAYDVTHRSSFDNLPIWLKELHEVIGDVPTVLVGNKCDIEVSDAAETTDTSVSVEEADKFAFERRLRHFRASAMYGINVKEGFTALCEEMMAKLSYYELPDDKVNVKNNKNRRSCAC